MGISWLAGTAPEERRKRTIPLRLWKPLLEVPGIQLVSLQHGDVSREIREASERAAVPIHTCREVDPLNDLDGLASLTSALDLVITADNSAAHLAGALGVPTWNLIPAGADWRWMFHRKDSLWFPSMRLVRQPRPHDWTGVMDRVARDLATLGISTADHTSHRRRAA